MVWFLKRHQTIPLLPMPMPAPNVISLLQFTTFSCFPFVFSCCFLFSLFSFFSHWWLHLNDQQVSYIPTHLPTKSKPLFTSGFLLISSTPASTLWPHAQFQHTSKYFSTKYGIKYFNQIIFKQIYSIHRWDLAGTTTQGTIYQPLRSGRIWHKVNF